MLRHRLIVGPLLIAGLLVLLWLDQRLGAIPLPMLLVPTAEGLRPLRLASLLARPELPAGGVMVLTLLVMLGAAAREMAMMFAAKGERVHGAVLWAGAAAGALLMYFSQGYGAVQPELAWLGTWLIVVLLIALRGHTLGGRSEGALAAAGATLLGLVYLGVLPGFFLAIRQGHSAWVVAAVILIVKSCDIGAYFTGKAIGRHSLIDWLSPSKTWEGTLGGMVIAGLVTGAGVWLAAMPGEPQAGGAAGEAGEVGLLVLSHHLTIWQAVVGGAILGGVGQIGDLIVSLMKRDAGFKDSGTTLPGFGGLLDIMDSPLLAAPVAYWLLLVV